MKKYLMIVNLILLSLVSTAQKKWLPGVIGYASSGYYKSQPAVSGIKTRGVSSLPSSFSLREYTPSVGEQQGGTCVGWATTYAGLSILDNIKYDIRDQSIKDSNVFSPYFTYTLCKEKYDDECEEGLYIEKALSTLQSVGAIKEKDYSSVCSSVGSKYGLERVLKDTNDKVGVANLIATLKRNRLKGFIPIAGIDVVQNMKYYLNKKMPIIVGVEMYQSIVDNLISNVWTGVIDDYPGGHAMCVVGYDDNKYGGAFEIMNSWGKEYGDSGFIWFRYMDLAKIVDVAYALSGIENIENIKTSDYNFNITLSAVGANSSKTIPIEQTENYFNGIRFSSQNSLLNTYTLNYTEEDESYRLNISTENESPLYVYMLSYKNSYINIQTSFADKINFVDKKNGLILPTNSYSAYSLMKNNYENKPYCLLICRSLLDETILTASLEKQYNSIEDYLQINFSNQLGINKPFDLSLWDGKIKIIDKNEPNDILPIIIKHRLDNKKNNLFRLLDINTTDYSLENSIEEVFAKFKIPKGKNQRSNLSIKVKVQKNDQGYSIAVSCSEEDDLSDLIFNDEITKNYKKLNASLFEFTIIGTSKSLPAILEKQLFNNLNRAKIPFSFSSN